MDDPRVKMAAICRMAYDRKLLDSAGGNLTVRAGDRVYMSPRYAGSKQQWQLEPSDFLVVDREGELLAGAGKTSRESAMHLAVYRHFPLAGCVFHAHPQNVMVFASACRPIPPTSEQTDKFGEIPLVQHAAAHSQDLAESVVEGLRPSAHALERHGIACLLPRHGIVCVASDLDAAYDTLERIDRGARMYLFRLLLETAPRSLEPRLLAE
jgi:ribulose-5-phosphate 4-epimerase/fuculose-1-phosphate aldolase